MLSASPPLSRLFVLVFLLCCLLCPLLLIC
nr:MAG TPA: hypothetical protein [Inoviridae sp.]